MHRLDLDPEVWREAPNVAYQGWKITRIGCYESPVVDGDPVCRRYFLSVERVVKPRDNRPRRRVRCGFARDVARIKFLEGGVDVVDVEPDFRENLVVGVDLNNVEHLGTEFAGPNFAVGSG